MTNDQLIERILAIKALIVRIESDYTSWASEAVKLNLIDGNLIKEPEFQPYMTINEIKKFLKKSLDQYRVTLCEKEDK